MKKVNQFKVVVMSTEFLKQIAGMPECFDASSIGIPGGKTIQGGKTVLIVKTVEEIIPQVPSIIAEFPEPKDQQHIVVVQMDGQCEQCKDDEEVCPHMGITVFGRKQILGEVDISKIPVPQP